MKVQNVYMVYPGSYPSFSLEKEIYKPYFYSLKKKNFPSTSPEILVGTPQSKGSGVR